MDADQDDSALFHALIRAQRNTKSTNTQELVLNDHLYTGDLMEAWNIHFGQLATPRDEDHYRDERQQEAAKNVKLIEDLLSESTLPIEISKAEVLEVLNSLKTGKAHDAYNLTAEHLRNAPYIITEFITPIINQIFTTGEIPRSLKVGLLHPIHKKGKLPEIPGNYRGITITPIVMKVMDRLILDHQSLATPNRLHHIQFGFMEGKSGAHAAFLVTEAVEEANRETIFAASLDVEKAFDTVKHPSLLDKLHELGMTGVWWKLKQNSYRDLKSRIVWNGTKSDKTIPILQGNGQGKLTSPDDYISYLYNLMKNITSTGLGYYIGDTCISIPTCADDMMVLAPNLPELQVIMAMIEDYANAEQYNIHPTKSEIIPFNMKSDEGLTHLMSNSPVTLNGNPVPIKETTTHLGIKRGLTSSKLTVEARISTGRRTLYALMGAGLHGTNGLPVKISIKLYETYVQTRVLYGIESIKLTKSDVNNLELFHRKTIRSLLGLPERTAIPGLYILSGCTPMIGLIHLRVLTFLLSLLREPTTREVVVRQYVMKDTKSSSWVVEVQDILQKYNLPTIPHLLDNTPSKLAWKQQVKSALHNKISCDIEEEAQEKSTLRYLAPYHTPRATHDSVAHINNSRQVTRANVKTRVLLGVYPLANAKRRTKQSTTATCRLCHTDQDEDEVHFLTQCSSLEKERSNYMHRISQLIPNTDRSRVLQNNRLLTGIILDPDHPDVMQELQILPRSRAQLEEISRDFIYAVHIKRSALVRDQKN